MTDSNATSSTRQYDTLVSPLESADEPTWLHRAAPQERRQWLEHQRNGQTARREATQVFATLQSLYHSHRTRLPQGDAGTLTPHALLALHRQQSLDAGYLADLTHALDSDRLRSAKADAYLATLREEFSIAAIKGHVGKQGKRLLEWIIGAFAQGSMEALAQRVAQARLALNQAALSEPQPGPSSRP